MKVYRPLRNRNSRASLRASLIEPLETRTLLSAVPDLSLSVVSPAGVVAGQDATYTFTTTNLGKTVANVISYIPPVGYPTGCSQVSFALASGPTILRPGQSQVYTLVLAVDAYVASGTVLNFPVEVTTPKGNSDANSTVTINTPVSASADLNLVVTGPAEVTAGTSVTFDIGTINAGPSTETTGLYTPPSGFPAGVTQLSYTLISGPGFALAPGDQDVYALVMSVSPDIANGTVISFPAVLTGGVSDPNSANNTATISTTVVHSVIAPVNIALTSSTFNSTSTLGEAVGFTAAITPVTPVGVTPTGTVTFTSDGVALGTETVQSDGTATLPSTTALTGGYHTIIASYSGDSTYGATTKSLTQVVTVPVPSTVVPTFGKVTLPTAVVSGAKFKSTLPVVLTNNGSKQIGIFTITLFADTGTTLDGNQVQIGLATQKRLTLATDTHTSLTFHPTVLPSTLAAGTYHILAQMTDGLGFKNVVATTQTITTAAPFVALTTTVAPVIPTTIAAKKTGSITITVTNTGNINATGPLTISVLPSTDGITAASQTALVTLARTVTIRPGKPTKYTLHIKDVPPLVTGTFYPYVVVTVAGVTSTMVGTTPFTIS